MPELPLLRPAGVLTSAALDGCAAALDVGITASGASETDGDPAADMHTRKYNERANIADTLAAQNIRYVPIIWTSFGRPHEAASEVLGRIARQVARRRGDASHTTAYRQMCKAIGTEIARRGARVSLACWPSSWQDGGVEVSDSDTDSDDEA